MPDTTPNFHKIGQYAKSLADDVLFTLMAEAVYFQCLEMGFEAISTDKSCFPKFSEDEFDKLMRATLTARHREMFQQHSDNDVANAIDQQIMAGFGVSAVWAILMSFSENGFFFKRINPDHMV